MKRKLKKFCSENHFKKRLPIVEWLPKYSLTMLFWDAIAGLTVGLTAIPQGIAYAVVAGLPPQFGLYSSIFPGFVYLLFGSCKDVIVGPTAILAMLVSKYVLYSADFAVLAGFLSGCIIFLLGILNLGSLLQFVSLPVITGFTTAAALQIAASQIKPLFGLSGSSGSTFITALRNFILNFKTMKLWDPLLGCTSIVLLIIFQKIAKIQSEISSSQEGGSWRHTCIALLRIRNAHIVCAGAIIAYLIKVYTHTEPFALTGTIKGGLPVFGPPPFSTVVGNTTYTFSDMINVYGLKGLVMPFVAVLESIAIAKAFAGSSSVDSTQEMFALGLCNILSSFAHSMPITGSFTRTAINQATGVTTPAGGLFKEVELCVYVITISIGLTFGVEYGICAGVLTDVVRLLHTAAHPQITVYAFKVAEKTCILLTPIGGLMYCSSEYFCYGKILNSMKRHVDNEDSCIVVLDGQHLHSMDNTVAKTLSILVRDLDKSGHVVIFWKFTQKIRNILENTDVSLKRKFIETTSIEDYIADFLCIQ